MSPLTLLPPPHQSSLCHLLALFSPSGWQFCLAALFPLLLLLTQRHHLLWPSLTLGSSLTAQPGSTAPRLRRCFLPALPSPLLQMSSSSPAPPQQPLPARSVSPTGDGCFEALGRFADREERHQPLLELENRHPMINNQRLLCFPRNSWSSSSSAPREVRSLYGILGSPKSHLLAGVC